MSEESDRLKLERSLLRQSVVHHLKRERVLEEQLAALMAAARHKKCGCPANVALRHLAKELEG